VLNGPYYQLENVAHLDQLPPRGAMVMVGFPPIEGGSGSPARVIALLPDSTGK
jgi:kynurenine formamidase